MTLIYEEEADLTRARLQSRNSEIGTEQMSQRPPPKFREKGGARETRGFVFPLSGQ
jgi:hypothetical protein